MFKRPKSDEDDSSMTRLERAKHHQEIAERITKLPGVGNKQMVRVAVQASAHASLAVSYLLQEQIEMHKSEHTGDQ